MQEGLDVDIKILQQLQRLFSRRGTHVAASIEHFQCLKLWEASAKAGPQPFECLHAVGVVCSKLADRLRE
jgi:hypothetical protein